MSNIGNEMADCFDKLLGDKVPSTEPVDDTITLAKAITDLAAVVESMEGRIQANQREISRLTKELYIYLDDCKVRK